MCPLAAHISEGCHKVFWQLSLYAQAPLLRVRVLGVDRDGSDVDRECSRQSCSSITGYVASRPKISDASIPCGKRLRNAHNIRSTRLQRSCIGFVPGAVLEKDSIAGAHGSLAIPLRIPREADPWRRVKYMAVDATFRNTVRATFNNSVGDARIQISQIQRHWLGAGQTYELSRVRINLDLRRQRFAVGLRFPVKGAQIFLVVVSEQAHAQSQVYG